MTIRLPEVFRQGVPGAENTVPGSSDAAACYPLPRMAYVANLADLERDYLGKVIGSGQCVALVEKAAGTPTTAQWKRGRKVAQDLTVAAGTAIATFDPDGTYGNHTDGRSHAAVYVSQDEAGLSVYDQWLGQPVHSRDIRFKAGKMGLPVNDGDQFYVIE